MVEDYLRSYDVDGLMWGSERQGPLGNAIVANHGGAGAGGGIACFCQYCTAEAKKRGIDVDRAREGYLQLAAFVNAGRDGRRPADGVVRDLLAAVDAVPRDPGMGASLERRARGHVSRHVPPRQVDRAD